MPQFAKKNGMQTMVRYQSVAVRHLLTTWSHQFDFLYQSFYVVCVYKSVFMHYAFYLMYTPGLGHVANGGESQVQIQLPSEAGPTSASTADENSTSTVPEYTINEDQAMTYTVTEAAANNQPTGPEGQEQGRLLYICSDECSMAKKVFDSGAKGQAFLGSSFDAAKTVCILHPALSPLLHLT